ncbi:PEP-CTERM sorting domain-containing protein [Aquabacterium sp.]|uniref:PEP-CTERM sorting domain-containing protein n=1 Tax=Aquabacterium sp. TaxID=1872578 RepID=UPI002618C60C|nr:PEP-CTERM sorting domain-containing protein [Aquabacterium sp.]MDD2977948.1 PEP-CTERM sorting domain-containing protein [Aquabacterium sp.]
MSDMVRMGLRPASLALAAALCFGSSAQAADDPLVAQASVTLSGLSFQLIDLTPGDGIAPSLSFQTEGIIDMWNTVYDEASDSWLHSGPTYSNSLLPTTPVNYTTPDGLSTVTSTSNSVTLQSQVALSQVLPPLSPPDGTGTGDYVSNWAGTGTDLAVGAPYDGGYQSFTLGAGTGLVLRGTLSTQFTVDSSAVQNEMEANGYDTWSLTGGGDSSGSFVMAAKANELFDIYGNLEGFEWQQGNNVQLYVSRWSWHGSSEDNTMLNQSESQDFEFTVVNFGDSTLTGVLALQLDVYSNVGVSAEHFSTIPTIPEPSTYALMGLGLVGIAAVARRRRHTA